MIKKILLIILVFIFSINSIFAYNPTKKDKIVLNKIYRIVDKKFSKKQKARKLLFAIKKIKLKYKNKNSIKKQRIYYLLVELEKYLEKKFHFSKTKKYSWKNNYNKIKDKFKEYNSRLLQIDNSKNNLTPENQIKKIPDPIQDKEIKILKKAKNKKLTKKIIKKLSTNSFSYLKNKREKILKTTYKNWVFVKYVKKQKKYIPKNTPKNRTPKIENKFLITKIINTKKFKNTILIKYYSQIKILKITWLEDYSCNNSKLNIFLKNNLENKKVQLENIKKINKNTLSWEIYINWESILKKILNWKICEIKK